VTTAKMTSVPTVMNAILDPVISQVIGSTPESLVDAVKGAELRNKSKTAMQLASVSIFAAAVNKSTLETFASGDAVSEARPAIRSTLSIQGKTNMTALTLLGHCLLTTAAFDSVRFVQELRLKLGVRHLWDGDLSTGSTSEKQRKIYEEKKRKTNVNSARLFASGFLKWTGLVNEGWTREEAAFWKVRLEESRTEPVVRRPQGSTPAGGSSSTTAMQSGQGMRSPILPPQQVQEPPSPPKRTEPTDDELIAATDQDVLNYYAQHVNDSRKAIAASIRRRGVAGFTQIYKAKMAEDPDGLTFKAAASTIQGV
jgi:hypothetical protein